MIVKPKDIVHYIKSNQIKSATVVAYNPVTNQFSGSDNNGDVTTDIDASCVIRKGSVQSKSDPYTKEITSEYVFKIWEIDTKEWDYRASVSRESDGFSEFDDVASNLKIKMNERLSIPLPVPPINLGDEDTQSIYGLLRYPSRIKCRFCETGTAQATEWHTGMCTGVILGYACSCARYEIEYDVFDEATMYQLNGVYVDRDEDNEDDEPYYSDHGMVVQWDFDENGLIPLSAIISDRGTIK